LWPSDWIIRATADSPYYSVSLIRYMCGVLDTTTADFVTTSYRRTLPKGSNLEAFKPELLRKALELGDLSSYDKEHVTSM
jgi:spore coat polysaccharide biosynthesis protein SpsF (cytidylyltransferase family)